MVTFHRRVFCWMDEWYGLSLADAQNIQLNLKSELAQVNLHILYFIIYIDLGIFFRK